MDQRFREHVERLVADAEREATNGDWRAARALAESALALQPGDPRAGHVLRRAQTALTNTGERRELTVLFSDVVGSTQLSSRADPETVRDILRSYQGTCAEVVEQYDGHIASYVGDGIVAYFGYPTTHDDDPRRAVLAGLHLLEALEGVAEAAQRRFDLPFAVRVAIHTGTVVRAEMGAPSQRDFDAIVGAVPNVASRLQEHAAPGTLVISGATYDLLRGHFSVKALGPVTLRGVPDPVEAYEVVGEGSDEVAQATPFCGRTEEMARLRAGWDVAHDGRTSKASIVLGEPGIGKSRLAQEFQAVVADAGGRSLHSACSPFHLSTDLYPVRRLVEMACGLDSRADGPHTVPLLRDALAAVGEEGALGVFADFLGLPADGSWERPELDGPRLREVTLATLVAWLDAAAAQAPIVVVIDDLQWADASTLELIDRVLRSNIAGLQLVLSARDHFIPPWGDVVDVVRLAPLADADLRTIAGSLPEGRDLEPDVLDATVSRSGGIPFFLEELVRAVGTDPVERVDVAVDVDSAIPPALRGPLLARIAAPGSDLTLCQVIATVGREADHDVLAALLGVPDETLERRLKALMDASLIEVVGGEHRGYRFRHDLLRDLAYETQLRPERRRLHSATADILDALDVHGVPGDFGALGYHLERAGRIPEAIDALARTAQHTLDRGALTETVEQLDHCLALLADVPDENARALLELSVRQLHGMAWVFRLGYSAPAAMEDFRRCVELCEVLGAEAGQVPSIEAIWYYYLINGELARAEEIVLVDRRKLDLGPDAVPEEGARCVIRLFQGDVTGAIADMEAFLSSPYAVEAGLVPPKWPLPDDPLINVLSFLGIARWVAGDPAGSRAAFAQAEERGAQLPFPRGPFGTAYAKLMQLLTFRVADLPALAETALDAVEEIAERHGFAFFQLSASGHRMINEAGRRGAYPDFDTLVGTLKMLGIGVWDTFFNVEFARVALAAGDLRTVTVQVDMGLDVADRRGNRFLLAELYRLRGLGRLAAGDPAGAEDLDTAIETARGQGARLFELRALIDRAAVADADVARAALAELVAQLGGDGLPELVRAEELLAVG